MRYLVAILFISAVVCTAYFVIEGRTERETFKITVPKHDEIKTESDHALLISIDNLGNREIKVVSVNWEDGGNINFESKSELPMTVKPMEDKPFHLLMVSPEEGSFSSQLTFSIEVNGKPVERVIKIEGNSKPARAAKRQPSATAGG